VTAVLLGLLAVVALTSSRDRPSVAGGTDAGAVADVRDIFLTVGATLYVLAVAGGIWLLFKFGSRGGGTAVQVNRGSFLIFIALAAGLYWGVQHHRPANQSALDQPAFGPGRPQLQPPPAQRPAATKPIPPAEFRWPIAAGLVVALAVAIGGVVVVRRLLRPAEVELEPLERRDRIAAELASIVAGTIDDLRREQDPRRAVIAAYAQMETALSNHGLPREPSEAPFEYLTRMLRELRVRAASALALTELFERARFSHHAIDVSMKNEAIDALVAVRDDLRAAPA